MAAYDANLCTILVGDRFINNFDEGTMVSGEKDEEYFSVKVDAQGNEIISEKNNNLGTISIPLSQNSSHVAYLNNLAKTRKEVPVWVTYSGEPREVFGGTRARVKKTAGKELGDEAGSREFELHVFDYTEE